MRAHTGHPKRHRLALGVVMLLALAVAACSPAERSIGIDAGEVAQVDLFFYDYSPSPTEVRRTSITDRGLIEELVKAFTAMPVRASRHAEVDLRGHPAAGVRFVQHDGTAVELTQVFVDAHQVVIFWQDGSRSATPWGRPLVDYYADLGETSTDVTTTEVPVAKVP
ncbi:hypothetical protein [Nocardioides limicola]|uniref:hypothetical protein n=1 Tax=Nocardioides limicola TaxID=2803368 RepID=UPI00193B7897|nr:hypothetical protein [Nocardioides sp. DJM-14]